MDLAFKFGTFDAKSGSLRRLSNAGENVLFGMDSERLRQADGRGRFTFTERSRCDSVSECTIEHVTNQTKVIDAGLPTNNYVFPVGPAGESLKHFDVDFSFGGTVGHDLRGGQTHLANQFHNVLRCLTARYVDVPGNKSKKKFNTKKTFKFKNFLNGPIKILGNRFH